ncbi:hypothetical protein MXD61_20305 [Frankia sp. AgPm24]|nr:hypothetical protein [Frankia sp. AgPm24]MCK9924180.1 hypothetical protein [Frankia sp. AgPm24]
MTRSWSRHWRPSGHGCGGYEVPLDELVGSPPTGDPRVHGTPISFGGITAIPLSRRPGGIQTFKMILPAGSQ